MTYFKIRLSLNHYCNFISNVVAGSFIFGTLGSVMDFYRAVRITDITYKVIRDIILTFGGSSINVIYIINYSGE